jgi:WD40 repeat protein
MRRSCQEPLSVLAGIAMVGLISAWVPLAAADPPAPTHRLGDPLPEGATARLGTSRLWHGTPLASLALSPDGKLIATGGGSYQRPVGPGHYRFVFDGRIRLWETATGKEARCLRVGERTVRCLSFSPDGRLLAAGCEKDIVLWDAATGKEVGRLRGHQKAVASVAFSANGRLLHSLAHTPREGWWIAAADDSEVAWWDVAACKQIRLRQSDAGKLAGTLERLALAPDARVLLKSYRETRSNADPSGRLTSEFLGWLLRASDPATGKALYQVERPAKESNGAVVFTPDGKRFAWGGNSLWIGDARTGRVLRKIAVGDVHGTARGLCLSADGRKLATAHLGGGISLWDTDTGKKVGDCGDVDSGERNRLGPIFSGDSRLLAWNDAGGVRLWDVVAGKETPTLPGHRQPVGLVGFQADGRTLASTSERMVYRWDVASGKEVGRPVRRDRIRHRSWLAGSPDGEHYLMQAPDGSVQLCTTDGDKLLHTLAAAGTQPRQAHFSPDGKHVILRHWDKGAIRASIYDVARGARLGEVVLFEGNTTEGNRTLGWWTMALLQYRQPVVSPDGKYLAWTGTDGGICLGEVATGKVNRAFGAAALVAELPRRLIVYQFAFSPDGKQLSALPVGWDPEAVGAEYLALDVRDVPTGRLLRRLPGRKTSTELPPTSLAYSPDGRMLAIGHGGDGRIQLWELASGKERCVLSGHRGDVLSLAFTADGGMLASGGEDGTILLWDLHRPAARSRP